MVLDTRFRFRRVPAERDFAVVRAFRFELRVGLDLLVRLRAELDGLAAEQVAGIRVLARPVLERRNLLQREHRLLVRGGGQRFHLRRTGLDRGADRHPQRDHGCVPADHLWSPVRENASQGDRVAASLRDAPASLGEAGPRER